MNSNFKFLFKAGKVNNQFMSMQIKINEQLHSIHVCDNFCVQLDVNLPTEINFILTGKNANDTIMHGDEIIEDKFIMLEKIFVDNFEIDPWQLPEKYFKFLTLNNECLKTNFWHTNGNVKLTLDQEDPVLWFLECPDII